jgi:hypothetical protein
LRQPRPPITMFARMKLTPVTVFNPNPLFRPCELRSSR